MGAENRTDSRSVVAWNTPPADREFELTLLGPGYGESILLHIGFGKWVIVDSCTKAGVPQALQYLHDIGVVPEKSVALIVATHWHDDHLRGLANLVKTCSEASFCCSSAFCRHEFLGNVAALEERHLSACGSGLRELYNVFSCLAKTGKKPERALANRRIFADKHCEIWSLSPSDAVFERFIRSIGALMPAEGTDKGRIRDLSPNDVAVALWVAADGFSLLLGSDLEKNNWVAILKDTSRPQGSASVFKIPHHGSAGADEPGVWTTMLETEPLAVLAPWQRGNGRLPTLADVRRIQSRTSRGYATSDGSRTSNTKRGSTVERMIKRTGAQFTSLTHGLSSVRLRRPLGAGGNWTVGTFGRAVDLSAYERNLQNRHERIP